MRLHLAAASHQGHVRKSQQDAALIDAAKGLALVADGMGGHPAGEVAAAIAVATAARSLAAGRRVPPGERLRAAVAAADAAVRAHGDAEPGRKGMGTTLVALLVEAGRAHVLHCGDSRAYRLRAGKLERLTRDDAQGGYLTTAVGLGGCPRPRAPWHEAARAGDVFMLCSDGLWGCVEDAAIGEALATAGPATTRHAAERLVALALDAGGPDNVTVVVGRVVGA